MKKVFIAATLIATSFFSVNAQDETPVAKGPILSKRGYPILPEAGDYSLSIDATVPLNYLGNFFGKTADNTYSNGFLSPIAQTVMLRKFIDANTAYRAIVGINLASNTTKASVNQDGVTVAPGAAVPTVDDKRTTTSTLINIGAGLEKRRGVGRLQGIYGAQAILSYIGGGKDKYSYGNSISATDKTPTSHDFNGNINGNSRTTVAKNGSTFGLAVQAFVGVEYFIAPKISLGGEFAWGPRIAFTGKGNTESETWNGTAVQTTSVKNGGGSSIGLDFQNATGALRLNFFF